MGRAVLLGSFRAWRGVIIVLLLLVSLLLFGRVFRWRWDLTGDGRYTLARSTRELLDSLDGAVYVKSYLGGEIPLEFARLRIALEDLLEEYRVLSDYRVSFTHEDPNGGLSGRERALHHEHLISEGIRPVNTQERGADGSVVERLIFPGISVSYRGRIAHAQLYGEDVTRGVWENVDGAIQGLEYALSSTISRLLRSDRDRVVLLSGRGSLDGDHVSAYSDLLRRDFAVERSVLDTTVGAWDGARMAVLLGPRESLTEREKLNLDQYVMGGGRLLLAVNPVLVGVDTLQQGGQTLAYAVDQNVGDLLFRWGFRVPPVLVQDAQCALIPVNTAIAGQSARFTPSPWPYFPLLTPNPRMSATRNVNLVYSRFPSHVEVLGGQDSTSSVSVLLSTSPFSRTLSTPRLVDLGEMQRLPRPSEMQSGMLGVCAVREGVFRSHYSRRPLGTISGGQRFTFRDSSVLTRVAILSDPTIFQNEVRYRAGNAQVLPLGFDKYTQQSFGNGEFAVNLAYWLAGYDGLLSLRNRELSVRLLSQRACREDRKLYQWLNMVVPSFVLILLGLIWYFARVYRYGRRSRLGS